MLPKSSNGRKIARIAPILTIFGQNWSSWPDLSFETNFAFFLIFSFVVVVVVINSLWIQIKCKLKRKWVRRMQDRGCRHRCSRQNGSETKSAIFGRTDLSISVSRAKFDGEADFEVRSAVARQKPRQIGEKQNFRSEFFADNFFWESGRFFVIFSRFWRS